jgi:methylmalonyl-CoA mutase N-terminal domain/subunit
VVGVNQYSVGDDEGVPILRIDPELERKQSGRLEATRARRDPAAVEATLGDLKRTAATGENLMPCLLGCARARASEGEMVAALQEVFGTYTEQPVF